MNRLLTVHIRKALVDIHSHNLRHVAYDSVHEVVIKKNVKKTTGPYGNDETVHFSEGIIELTPIACSTAVGRVEP